MPNLTIISWRDIPSQVVVRSGRTNHKRMLSERFQEAIDRAAMRAGKGSSDAYLSEWKRVSSACSDDIQGELDKAVSRIESEYSDAALTEMVRRKGLSLDCE